jgi:asparagine synthase (glutamine-hydrolysing)
VPGILGIFNLDGSPVDSGILARMAGAAIIASGPSPCQQSQPFLDEVSGAAVGFDGRIDNREELRAALGVGLRTGTDAELVLRSFERWGEDGPGHLLGDFAYSIWQPSSRTLFCARDHLGIRPFYYYTSGQVFLWASEPRSLLRHPAVARRPNEGMVAEYLSASVTSVEETLYQGIFRLPPATSLVAGPSGLRKRRYWNIDPGHQIRYKTDREYADRFRETFKEAVRCRLDGGVRVAAQLSGGVDSSSVVGACQQLLREGEAPNVGFEAFSLVFPGFPADETSYIRQVEELWGIASHKVVPPTDPDWYPVCARQYLDLPDHANFHMGDSLAAAARERGFGAILTGLGGDDWFGLEWPQQSRVRRALRRLRAQPNLAGIAALSRDLLRRVNRRPAEPDAAPWLPAAFRQRTGLAERTRRPSLGVAFPFPEQSRLYDGTSNAFRLHALEMTHRASVRRGLEHRHPFYDRRVVEFALAIPPDQIGRRGLNKYVLRQAMQGLLPEPIRQRTSKAEFSHTCAQVFEADSIAALFRSPRIAAEGWIDREQLLAMYGNFMGKWKSGQKHYLPQVWPLNFFLSVELWFRAAFDTDNSDDLV